MTIAKWLLTIALVRVLINQMLDGLSNIIYQKKYYYQEIDLYSTWSTIETIP
jgi:hypothetical protein